jgi:hypothetical protein
MSVNTPSRAQLQRALTISEQIHKLEQELTEVLGGSAPATTTTSAPKPAAAKPGKRFVSAEARAKMAAAQAARWARSRGQSAGPATAVTLKAAGGAKKGPKKRVLSAEGRAKIVAALKARHAANRAAKSR